MAYATEADVRAFIERCQQLVADGDDDEFSFRMHTLIRWWLRQMLHSCADDPVAVMHFFAEAVQDVGIDMAVVPVPVESLRRAGKPN
jgi:hypothetical protein